jgi:Putative zinc-finger
MTAGCGGTARDPDQGPYSFWDAAYVLGSLSSDERREYESHLADCAQCRAAVTEISGMPALLALLDRDEMAAADDPPMAAPLPQPQDLGSLLTQVRARRRRFRWVVAGLSAAAACLAIGLVVSLRPVAPAAEPDTSAAAMAMAPIGPSSYQATVTLTEHGWGTQIGMACTYAEEAEESDEGHDGNESDRLAMVAIGRDGSQTQLATWMAETGATALPNASTSLAIDEIAAVRVVSAESGDVLLERTL